MRATIFFNFLIFSLSIFLFENINSRELSIKQIEDRKREDLERLKKREKRGNETFSKDINLETKIIFLTKERKVPPVLSNLDPILDDEGYYGVDIAIEDNLTTGRFLGHNYSVEFHKVLLKENLTEEFKKLIKKGEKYFVVHLNAQEIKKITDLPESNGSIIFNVSSKDDSLRNEHCRDNLFHISPSYSMLSDALTQYLVKKKMEEMVPCCW